MVEQSVKLLKHWLGHDAGQIVEIAEDTAQLLIKRGWAIPHTKHIEGGRDKMVRKVKTK